MAERKVRLDHLLGVYSVGSGDWPWAEEYDNLIDQTDTQKLLARIREEGIHEPVLLGTDGRVWDGHHRIIIAMHLGIDSVPVEFAGEDGALNTLIADKRAEWEAEHEWEWMVATELDTGEMIGSVPTDEDTARRVMQWSEEDGLFRSLHRRRIAGPWVPVEQEGEHR